MDGERKNFIKIWSSVLMSSCYCYGISKLVPKGTIRFFMFLPVIFLFLLLPLYLSTINLILPTAFFVTWLTTFKVLLLVLGTGPLSHPSLSFFHFLIIFCLPIKLRRPTSPNQKSPPNKTWRKVNLHNPLYHAKRASIMIFLISLGFIKHKLPRDIVLFLSCAFVSIGLQTCLETAAIVGQLLLGDQVEPPFDNPYHSTSFQDFWGCRWNRVASSSLRSTVFDPTQYLASGVLGRKWATILALLVTFVVSDLMHEIIFYYLGRVRPGWGPLLFFLVQGLCVVVESTIKRKFGFNWQLPQIVVGPLIFLSVLCMFTWLPFPELMEHNVVDRALEEYAALGVFVKDLGLDCVQTGYNLVVKLL